MAQPSQPPGAGSLPGFMLAWVAVIVLPAAVMGMPAWQATRWVRDYSFQTTFDWREIIGYTASLLLRGRRQPVVGVEAMASARLAMVCPRDPGNDRGSVRWRAHNERTHRIPTAGLLGLFAGQLALSMQPERRRTQPDGRHPVRARAGDSALIRHVVRLASPPVPA